MSGREGSTTVMAWTGSSVICVLIVARSSQGSGRGKIVIVFGIVGIDVDVGQSMICASVVWCICVTLIV